MKMHTVVISQASHDLIAAHSTTGRLYPARRVPGGFEVELEDEVMTVFNALSSDINVAIRMACSGQVGHA